MFLAQSSAGLGLQIGFWCNPRRVSGFKSVFDAIPGGFRASNRFLAQFPAGFGLQIGFWPNPRRVSGFKSVFGAIPGGFRGVRVGANCIRPIRRPPTGPNECVWRPSLSGRLEGECNSPLHVSGKIRRRGEDAPGLPSQPRQRPPSPRRNPSGFISVSFVGYAFDSTRIGLTPCATLSRIAW